MTRCSHAGELAEGNPTRKRLMRGSRLRASSPASLPGTVSFLETIQFSHTVVANARARRSQKRTYTGISINQGLSHPRGRVVARGCRAAVRPGPQHPTFATLPFGALVAVAVAAGPGIHSANSFSSKSARQEGMGNKSRVAGVLRHAMPYMLSPSENLTCSIFTVPYSSWAGTHSQLQQPRYEARWRTEAPRYMRSNTDKKITAFIRLAKNVFVSHIQDATIRSTIYKVGF